MAFFQLFAFALCVLRSVAQNVSIPEIHVTPGVYIRELGKVIPYESTLPTTFKVLLPSLQTLGAPPTCPPTDISCQLATATFAAYTSMRTEILEQFPYIAHNITIKKPKKVARGLFNGIGILYKKLFGTATVGDIHKLHANYDDIKGEFDHLELQVSEDHKNLISICANISDYTKTLQTFLQNSSITMRQAFESAASTNTRSTALLAYSIEHLSQVLYIQHALHSLTSAASDCRSNLFPRSILTSAALDARFTHLNSLMSSNGWEIAVGMPDFYTFKSTQCTFTQTHLFVTSEIPLRRVLTSIKLYEFIRVPFQFHEKQCFLHESTRYVAKHGDNVIPITNTLSSFCNLDTSKFCLIPSTSREINEFTTCARALLEKKGMAGMSEICPMVCHKSSGTQVTPISPTMVAVTGVRNFTFACMNSTSRSYLPEKNLGYMTLLIPCHCHVLLDGYKLNPLYPCPSGSVRNVEEVAQIIPIAWSHIRSALTSSDPYRFTNLTSAYNDKWLSSIPVLQIAPPKTIPLGGSFRSNMLSYFTDAEEDSSFMFGWTFGLTIIVALLVLKAVCDIFSSRGSSFRFSRLIPFSSLVTPTSAETSDTSIPAMTNFLSWIQGLEWTTLASQVITLFVFFILLILIYRILRIVRRSARCIENIIPSDDYDNSHRSSGRRLV